MSDGHFQTTLYPSSPYASGLKAGKAIMRQQAEQAFCKWFKEKNKNSNENEDEDENDDEVKIKAELKRFIEILNETSVTK